MTTIYFVRHAKPDYQNHNDRLRELTEKGLEDSRSVTAFLSDKKIDLILSSPYRRAIDTIKDFADKNEMPIFIVDDFREIRNFMPWILQFDFFANDFVSNAGIPIVQKSMEGNFPMRKELMDEYRSLNCFIKGGAPDMLIRKYHPSDCPRLAKLFYQTVHEVNKQDYTKEQLNAWATGEVDLSAWNHSFLEHYTLVAVEGDEILGFGDIDETGYLDRLYVHKDHQREGIASRLCDKLEAHVSGNIRTHASITAKPFFQNRGYKIIKEQQVERRGILLTNFVMELEKKWEKPAEEKNLMKKVIVIGSPGAGKSTFSRKLRAVTGLPLYHLDMIWHKPDRTNISREELVQEQKKIMENQSWIIDGNYLSTMELRLENCDTIFLLDYPLEVCLAGAKARIGLFTSFLKSMVKTGMSTFSDPETQRKTI